MRIGTAPPGLEKAPNRGFWAIRDIPTAFWLILAALATIVHRDLPEPRWLMIHLLFLGAITHAILVWSQHFSYALLRAVITVKDRRHQTWRLALANGGAAIILATVPFQWWIATWVGAATLIVAVVWHGWSIYRRGNMAFTGPFGRTVYYYIAAAAVLTLGAGLGAWMARGDAPETLVLAHSLLNVLGWIGLTVAGTVVVLWPTILRTRADDAAPTGALRALPALAVGVVVAAAGAALSQLPLLAIGLAGYVFGLAVLAVSLWRAARRSAPHTVASLSVGTALLWWGGSVAVLTIGVVNAIVTGTGFAPIPTLMDAIVPYLAAGFAAQVLVGALSYLVPVVIGGGPTPVRTGTAAFERFGILRVSAANTALVICALPVTSLMRVVASVLYLVAMASFLPIMFAAMRAQRLAKERGATLTEPRTGPIAPEGEQAPGRRAGHATAGMLAVVLAVTASAALDPLSLSPGAAAEGDPDAPVMTVEVEAHDMVFTPNVIEVPAGTRLIIELTNTDPAQTHDLRIENGVAGSRLVPGASETLDVGVIEAGLEGWCTIVGHRQMGMTMQIVAVGSDGQAVADGDQSAPPTSGGHSEHGSTGSTDSTGSTGSTDSAPIDLSADPGPDFEPFDAVLAPLPESDGSTHHELTLTVEDTLVEVAPGVTQTLWTYNQTAPGPVLHGRVGDTFEITLVNSATMGHSIDFHAGALAPDRPMRTIAPGESLTYTFTAERAGIWMYHCSTMPMTAHIANGMYGAVVIEPDGLPEVDHSYVLVQAEYYLGDHDGGEVDTQKIQDERPDLVTFNGYANQYDHAPLEVKTGERARFWVLNVGPNRASSFHIVGGQFDTVWFEGAYTINRAEGTGSQALGMQAAQGGFVELTFPEAGHYTFVSHVMIDAERGAHGTVRVTD